MADTIDDGEPEDCGSNEPHCSIASCVFCDRKMQEAMPDSLKNYQPYFGGEVKFVFAFGSTKFDDFPGCTMFRGLICDDCGKKYVGKMKKSGFDFNGNEQFGNRYKPPPLTDDERKQIEAGISQ